MSLGARNFFRHFFRNTRFHQWSAGFDKQLGLVGMWVADQGAAAPH